MKSTFNLKKDWRTTTALCIASTIAVATAAYAADSRPSAIGTSVRIPTASSTIGRTSINGRTTATATTRTTIRRETVKTASPIKHVIVLIGENRGLDHTFGVYKPKGKGETISNLLSKGIVNEDGTPGPNFAQAQQFSVAGQPSYYIGAPAIAKSPYSADQRDAAAQHQRHPGGAERHRRSVQDDRRSERREGHGSGDLDILTTGATGLPAGVARHPRSRRRQPDRTVPAAGSAASATTTTPVTPRTASTRTGSRRIAASPTRRRANNSGCLNDLFPFVMATYSATNKSLGNSMGFYNAEQEQAPILKMLADRFTLGDNFHQSFHGGTGANHFMLGTGDAAFWSDGKGNPATPPAT